MSHSWTKNAFWDVNNKKWRKWCKFVSHFYLITLMAYLCSQWKPNVQIKCFMIDLSIYKLFVLYRGWRRDSLQIMILEYVCSTCSVVELKARYESWKARNDLNGVRLFHLSSLITLMASLCSQWTPNVQINYCMFVRSTDHLC
jgi:uncharacterized protein YjaG (DUF416 family)